MFDQLWEESPTVQKLKAQYYEKGEVQTLQRMLVKGVQRRFPELTELAQKKVQLCNKPDTLELLFQQIQDAPDLKTVQQLLGSISEQQI